ncbi:MAG: tRNA (adenosine(37)-N6)-threonylcarbamoyltransferase complex dimerization subunit type 1 TsaB [Anaerolineae bacterium]|nr:tRNA (adenosine(37)-N6)-threonylcarbamoyltransferase complex dimerization subunit type 1 TsaB [Anaerolineae bacterium]
MLLAIDTATRTISLALHDGRRLHAELTWPTTDHHTVELAPAILRTLASAGLRIADLVGVAVAQGPGSFMGLRIGLSAAKGLAISRRLPLLAVPTLDIVAAAQPRMRGRLVAVLQAGRRRICAQVYTWRREQWRAKGELWQGAWPAFAEQWTGEAAICGEIDSAGYEALRQYATRIKILPGAASLRRAGYLAEVAWVRLREGQTDDPFTVTPIYIR